MTNTHTQPGSRSMGGTDDVANVRVATDIVELIAEHLALRPKGREFVGLCPFHDDKNPSMYVVPNKQIFHCFVCGAGGDAFTFIQRHLGLEFRETLELLAQRAGIELTRRTVAESANASGPSRGELCEANLIAQRFFATLLASESHGKLGRDTIERRGISAEMVELFGIGVSPDRWDGLIRKADQLGFDQRILVAAGLVKPRDDGSGYDTFRNRLMFPIYDASGRVIAFGARKLKDEDEPKYLNSPESAVFDKSASLFGLRQASTSIRREKAVMVVEGYTDVIACHQAGLTNAVASLGTALTSGHARLLRRLCERIVLVFDGDEAGQRAADRAVEVLFAEAIDVGVVTLDRVSDAKDPDELLKREGGAELLRDAVDNARDLLAYRYDRLAAELAGSGPAAMDKAVREELATLARLGLAKVPRSRRELIVRRLREITGLSERALAEALPTGRALSGSRGAGRRHADDPSDPSNPASGEMNPDHARGPLSPADAALGCVLIEPKLLKEADADQRSMLGPDAYAQPFTREIARVVFDLDARTKPWGLDSVLGSLDDPQLAARAVALHEQVRAHTADEIERVETLWRDCLLRLGRRAEQPIPAAPKSDATQRALAALEHAQKQRHTFGDDMTRLPRPRR